MKVILVTLFILLSSLFSFGQKTKTVEIWRKTISNEVVYANYNYDKDEQLINISVLFIGMNNKYKYIHDGITLFSGSPLQFNVFLKSICEFAKDNEARTSKKIDDHLIVVINSMGIKGVAIYDKEELGYRSFTLKALNKIKSKFVDWCKKNKVAYE